MHCRRFENAIEAASAAPGLDLMRISFRRWASRRTVWILSGAGRALLGFGYRCGAVRREEEIRLLQKVERGIVRRLPLQAVKAAAALAEFGGGPSWALFEIALHAGI